jgi:Ohr subfamily peroxiredoxin
MAQQLAHHVLEHLVPHRVAVTVVDPLEVIDVDIDEGERHLAELPEQLFAAGYAACYLGAIKFAASQDKSLPRVPADITVQATVGIGPRPDQSFGLKVGLDVALPGLTAEDAARLTAAGHGICPYSHATHGNIEVITTVTL